MKGTRHSEEQIIAALKQYESGDKVADIWRKLGERGHVLHVEKAVYGTECKSCVN